MRIAVFGPLMYLPPTSRGAVSAHAQLPLKTIDLLRELGHEVALLTTRPRPGHLLPDFFHGAADVVHFADASAVWPSRRRSVAGAVLQVGGLLKHLATTPYDIVHFFGHRNTLILAGVVAGMLRRTLQHTRFCATVLDGAGPATERGLKRPLEATLCGALDQIIALTEWSARSWSARVERDVPVTRPGVVKDLRSTRPPPEGRDGSVLYWRNANRWNGADVAVEAFELLASRHPGIQFQFAVRPGAELDREVLDAAARVPNITADLFPYAPDVTLESLVSRARCCVFPFRQLSVNPQMCILETLYAGCPVIVSNAMSNPELVQDGETGLVVPAGDARHLANAVETMLADAAKAQAFGQRGAEDAARRWNWQEYTRKVLSAYADCMG